LVANGDGGFVFPVGDTAAMAACVVMLLSDPRELMRQRDMARRRAVENFGVAKVVDRYEGLYRRLLGA
jgi:glycosyltransferase involved in cell wall biosynthesis